MRLLTIWALPVDTDRQSSKGGYVPITHMSETAKSLMPKTDFVGLEDFVHLAVAGESPTLKSHFAAMARFALDKSRGMLGREARYQIYAQVKERLARFMKAEPDDFAFLGSTSDGVNTLANCLEWRPGDNVVVEDIEYPANVYPWLRQVRRGVEVRVVHTDNWRSDFEKFAQTVDHRTRVISVSQVSYLTGRRFSLERLAELAWSVGAVLAVDVNHALGVLPVDASLADFMFSGCYKWILGFHGVGICYWNRRRQPDIEPLYVGWRSVVGWWEGKPWDEYKLKPDAGRIETGNPSFVSLYALDNSLDYFDRIPGGIQAVENHVLGLGERLRAGLVKLQLDVVTPAAPIDRAGNIVFRIQKADAVVAGMRHRGVLVWSSKGRVIISVHFYNDEADVDRCLNALSEVLGTGR